VGSDALLVPIEASSRVKLPPAATVVGTARKGGSSHPRSRARSVPPGRVRYWPGEAARRNRAIVRIARPDSPVDRRDGGDIVELRDGVLEEGHEPFSVTVIVWSPALAFGWTKICENAVPPSVVVTSACWTRCLRTSP